jgi:hypothetical protein
MVKEQLVPAKLRELFPEIDLITDQELADAVTTIWVELWEMSEFERLEHVPATSDVQYPQIKHCQGTLRVALAAASVWEEIHGAKFDRDVLIAGALLMDVSKMVELRPAAAGGVEYTDIGKALPHASYAAHLALHLGVPLPVVHIIQTHSRNSGKPPNTPECRLLDWIDQADVAVFAGERWRRQVTHVSKHA